LSAYSYVTLPGDGSNSTFAFSFPYLDRAHIHVKVGGVEVPFNWATDSTILILPAPTDDVEIRRITPLNQPPVDFTDGSVLSEQELDLLATFNLYCAQEAQDTAAAALLNSELGAAFYGVYQGAQATVPTTRRDGTPLQAGDLYFSTSLNAMQVYGSFGWKNAGSSIDAILKQPPNGEPFVAAGGETSIPIAGGYDPGNGIVSINGLNMAEPDVSITNGETIVFATPLSPGDEVDYTFFGAFTPTGNISNVRTFNGRNGDVVLTTTDISTALGFTPASASSNSLVSVAALRAASSTGVTVASTQGYYAAGDGGGATYYKDATDTTSTDNGGSVIVATDGARWKLAKAVVTSARQFGAKGDGVTSDTAALQQFANYLGTKGTRGYIPGGKYRLTSKVTFSENCLVYGDGWKDVRDMTGDTTRDWSQAKTMGTIIYADYVNSGASTESTFHIEGNSVTIRDMEFEAKQPLPGPGWVSNNTPFAISTYRGPWLEQGGNSVLIENVMLRNHKHGIHMQGTSRGLLRGIFGQCFGQAIYVTQNFDVLRIEDVHLNWPFYSGHSAVTSYMDTNADALVLARVDNPNINNFFVFGGRTGITTQIDADPTFGGKTERLQATNVGIDNILVGLKLKDAITMDLANFYVFCRPVTDSRCIHSLAELGGGQVPIRLNLTNGDFQGSQAEAMRFEVQGNIQLSNIRIRDYNGSGGAFPGIAAYDGVKVQYANLVAENTGTTPLTQTFGTGTISGGSGGSSGVSSFNSRTGIVNLTSADVTTALGFTPASASSSDIAGTIRSKGATPPASGVGVEVSYETGLDAGFVNAYDRTTPGYKNLNIGGLSVTFKSGTAGSNQGAFDSNGYFLLGYGNSQGAYKLQVSGDALFSGALYAPTPATSTTGGRLATCDYVINKIAAGAVQSFNTRTGAVTLTSSDVTTALGYTPASASTSLFTGTVRSAGFVAPPSGVGVEISYDTGLPAGFVTAYDRDASQYKDLNIGGRTITFKSGTAGTNQGFIDTNGYFVLGYGTSQGAYKLQVNGDALIGGALYAVTPATSTTGSRVATCDYVINKIAAGGVTSFNSRTGAVSLTSGDVTGALGYTPATTASPSFSGVTGTSGTFRSTGTSNPGSGTGVELNWDPGSTAAYLNSYDRTAAQYKNLNIGGLAIGFKTGASGANVGTFDANGSFLIGYGTTNGSTYKLQVNSQIYATSATIATSDRRVKENIQPLEHGLDKVMELKPVTFDFKKHSRHNFSTATQVGFIAQDVEEALAGTSYMGSVVATNEDGYENLKGLAEVKLVPLLVKAVQELADRVKELEAKLVA
jgi:hypothetical protein